MSDLVPAEHIEEIVGARRQDKAHLARAVSAEQTMYILHSRKCRASRNDLRQCPYSLALDNGIDQHDWIGFEDRPVVLGIVHREFALSPRRALVPSRSWDDR